MGFLRAELTPARRGGRPPESVDVDEAALMLTVVTSGLIYPQLANEPGVPYSAGRFSSLITAGPELAA